MNCIEHLLILASSLSSYAFISAFASLVSFPIGIVSSAAGLNICAITARIKKYKPLIKKGKKHKKIVLLAKAKLNSTEVLISRALVDSYISYKEFVLVNICGVRVKNLYLSKDKKIVAY